MGVGVVQLRKAEVRRQKAEVNRRKCSILLSWFRRATKDAVGESFDGTAEDEDEQREPGGHRRGGPLTGAACYAECCYDPDRCRGRQPADGL
jgi:hypothetical protein